LSGLSAALQAHAGTWILVLLVALLACAAALVLLAAHLRRLSPPLRHLVRQTEGKDLETVLRDQLANIHQLDRRVEQLALRLDELQARHRFTVQKVGLYRYDVESSLGGELSFVLCLLDELDNGVLISSLYRLDDCRVYAREIRGGTCALPLTPEEERALDRARNAGRPPSEA